jgi:dipeptidyl aminopeptidase/acylaminoacyl peptidase
VLAAILSLSACQRSTETPPPAMTPKSAPTEITTAPYGTWPSPISAAMLAQSAIGMSDVQTTAGTLSWRESRPAEGGRLVVVERTADGTNRVRTPEGFNVRTRVHEYGGTSYLRIGTDLIFSNFADQRLYRQRGDGAPVALTPAGYRWADCRAIRDGAALVCVREDHTEATVAANGEERNEVVLLTLPADDSDAGAGSVLATGTDFVAYPRVSPDGRQLAWISWNHPHMPWDEAVLKVAPLDGDRLGEAVTIAGGARRAPLEPQWDADGTLYFIDDPDGWWNLHRWRDGVVTAVAPMPREFGGPLWQHGTSTYALTGDGRAFVRTSLAARDEVGVIDLASGSYRAFDLPFVAYSDIRLLDANTAVAVAGANDDDGRMIAIDLAAGTHRDLHQPVDNSPPRELISVAEAIEFPTTPGADGAARTAHAFYYAPVNPGFRAPDGEKPPLIVTIHGGPTSVSKATLSLARQYWTTRGFAVVDVNYGGSTTYGRAYRERLNGQWGVVDVDDAVAAVDHLVAQGRVDPERLIIRGGSAGGYTTLAALAFKDRFKAGANLFGVADIKALAATSHKFERLYDVSLVGPPDEALYRARSPIHHLDGFTEPLITLQGAEDEIVPPEQSRMIFEALKGRGVPAAYIEFPGEQHGFRKAENIIRAQEAELYFYGRVFGFTPADAIKPVEIVNLAPRAGG